MPRSLVWATDIDVLALDRVVERRDGYLARPLAAATRPTTGATSCSSTGAGAGDAPRWEALFDEAFAGRAARAASHVRVGPRRTGDRRGARGVRRARLRHRRERRPRRRAALAPHPRENREVDVRALDPADGADEELWDAVVELQVAAGTKGTTRTSYRDFSRARLDDRRALFRAGRGAWYVASIPRAGAVAGSCGVVVTAAAAASRSSTPRRPSAAAASARGSWSRPRARSAERLRRRAVRDRGRRRTTTRSACTSRSASSAASTSSACAAGRARLGVVLDAASTLGTRAANWPRGVCAWDRRARSALIFAERSRYAVHRPARLRVPRAVTREGIEGLRVRACCWSLTPASRRRRRETVSSAAVDGFVVYSAARTIRRRGGARPASAGRHGRPAPRRARRLRRDRRP